MAQVSTGVVVAVAIGGGVLLALFGILLVRFRLRAKHKRRLAEMTIADEKRSGRLGRSPSSIMHITDEDVARMPGTTAAHRSPQRYRTIRSPYTPMSSRVSLESGPVLKSLERVKRSDNVGVDTSPNQWSRPLPRRLQRSDGTPLVKIPKSSPTSMIEWRKEFFHAPAEKKDTRMNGNDPDQLQRPTSREMMQNTNRRNPPPKELMPPPLFHNRERSVSHVSDESKSHHIHWKGQPAKAEDTKASPVLRPNHQKSTSICSLASQAPSEPPMQMLPPLSFELRSKRANGARSPTDFSGCGSLLSDCTSILDYEGCITSSRAETNMTSMSILSPKVSSPASRSNSKGSSAGLWNYQRGTEIQRRASPANAALSLRPPLNSQRSFRASIEGNLPRSTSSGLSIPILDHASSTGYATDLTDDDSSANLVYKIRSPRRKKSKRGISSSSPLKRGTSFAIHEDSTDKNSSLQVPSNVLNDSGMGLNADTSEKRPPSIATSNPFHWDGAAATLPDKPMDEPNRHKRRFHASVSDDPNNVASNVSYGNEERHVESSEENLSSDQTIVRRTRQNKQNSFRPPSRPTFDLQFPLIGHRTSIRRKSGRDGLPQQQATFSFYELPSDGRNSPDSVISTPTRKPSHRAQLPSQRNSQKPFFDPSTNTWHLPQSARSSQLLEPPYQTQRVAQEQLSTTDSNYSDSRPGSHLFNFPDPPTKPSERSSWRDPKTPIRGPRPKPEGFDFGFSTTPPKNQSKENSPSKFQPSPPKSPFRRGSTRRRSRTPSPSKTTPHSSPSKRVYKTYATGNNSPGQTLRRSIMALRRQNSEVNTHVSRGSREHRRYQSIGEVFEDKEDMGGKQRESGTRYSWLEDGDGVEEKENQPVRDAEGEKEQGGEGKGNQRVTARNFSRIPRLARKSELNRGSHYDRKGFYKDV